TQILRASRVRKLGVMARKNYSQTSMNRH
ncbi:MAG: hypothetical protein QOG50_2138, partial [Actinomycetota bacterium]|nr:hypothetical protein [Actinomycetota bacterium]